jgi:hypothetical protein
MDHTQEQQHILQKSSGLNALALTHRAETGLLTREPWTTHCQHLANTGLKRILTAALLPPIEPPTRRAYVPGYFNYGDFQWRADANSQARAGSRATM